MTMGETIIWLVANPMREVRRCFSKVNYRFTGSRFEMYTADVVEPEWTPAKAESMLFDNSKEFLIWRPEE